MKEFVHTKLQEEVPFIEKVQRLGWKKLTLLYSSSDYKKLTPFYRDELQKNTSLELFFGVIIVSLKENCLINKGDFKIVLGTSFDVVFKDITHVYNNELEEQKDGLHQRRSGLNHVILKEMKKKKVSVLVSYAQLQETTGLKRNTILGRIQQNILLCRKENVKISLVSLATNQNQLRHQKDVKAMMRVLGF